MSAKYNKSDNEYGRIMSIWLYALFFFGLILIVQIVGLYRSHLSNTSDHCFYIAEMLKKDVSYSNTNAFPQYFNTKAESLNPTLKALGLVHWSIKTESGILAEEVKHQHNLINNLIETESSCPIQDIRNTSAKTKPYTLSISTEFIPSHTQILWMILSSIFLAGLPLLIYSKITKERIVEKNQILEFFSQVAQRGQRNLTKETTQAESISLILQNESQSIISFIDETRALNDQIDPEYINRLEQNFIDLEERSAYLSILNKELSRQTTLKSSFFANLSHDFRTPLYTIDGYSKLLLGTKLKRNQLSHINAIQTASTNLSELISNFLSLSRLEAGKIDLEYSALDIRKLLDEIATGLSFLTTEHKNHFFIDVSDQLPSLVQVDAIKLRQILANLISNAIKYTRGGLIYVRVTCRSLDENVLSLSISVSDTGKGISNIDVETIFDPYNRLDADKTDVHGTGLGLGICKELCEVINAKLSVESVIDKGSIFTVDINAKISPTQEHQADYKFAPLGHDLHVFNGVEELDLYLDEWLRPLDINVIKHPWERFLDNHKIEAIKPSDKIFVVLDYDQLDTIENWAPKLKHLGTDVIVCLPMDILEPSHNYHLDSFVLVTNSISNNVLSESITQKENSQTNIFEQLDEAPLKDYVLLLAEDNDLNRKIIEERLNAFGARVISCPDGSAALELYKARDYSAILMDAHMPKISGTQLTEIIRRDFGDKTTPIIGITASTSTVEYQHFIRSGMTDCLIKPLQDKILIETIQKFAKPQVDDLNDEDEDTEENSLIETTQSSPELTTQDRIDQMSLGSIKEHLVQLDEILLSDDITEKQHALFNEIHKLNGTLSMTSFKDLQVRVNEIETLINPVLISTESTIGTTLIKHMVEAEDKLEALKPELKALAESIKES